MAWVLDQDNLDAPSVQGRLDELRNHVHAVAVRRADGAYDVLVQVDLHTRRPVAPPVTAPKPVSFH